MVNTTIYIYCYCCRIHEMSAQRGRSDPVFDGTDACDAAIAAITSGD